MPLPSVQFNIAQKYGTAGSFATNNIKGLAEYSDMTSSNLQQDMPYSLSASTTGSFGAQTSWRSKHIGLKGLQHGNIGSTINFNTNQVDPTVR